MADVVVNIGGDVTDLQKAASQATKELKKIGAAQKDATRSSSSYSSAATQVSSALNRTAGSSRQAQTAMTNLNRVVQDAPFGFIAIQNNIDPLIDSFISLRRESGSGKAALKALASSFVGPSGILTLVSLGAAAFVAFGDKIVAAFNKGSKAAADAKKAFKSAVEDVINVDVGGQQIQVSSRNQLVALVDAARDNLKKFEDELAQAANSRRGTGATFGGAASTGRILQGNQQFKDAEKAFNITKLQADKEREIVEQLEAQLISLDARNEAIERLKAIGGTTGADEIAAPETTATIKQSTAVVRQYTGEIQKLAAAKLDAVTQNNDLISTEQLRQVQDIESIDLIKQREQAYRSMADSINVGQLALLEFGSAAAVSLAEAVLGFEKLESVLDGVRSILRNVVRDLVAAAAKAAVLSFLFPGSAQAAGGFSGLFKGALGLRPFATGGIVTGPTPALIGEAGPEAVIPLNRLSGIMNARPLEVKALRVSGGDLLLTLQEAQNARGGGAISLK